MNKVATGTILVLALTTAAGAGYYLEHKEDPATIRREREQSANTKRRIEMVQAELDKTRHALKSAALMLASEVEFRADVVEHLFASDGSLPEDLGDGHVSHDRDLLKVALQDYDTLIRISPAGAVDLETSRRGHATLEKLDKARAARLYRTVSGHRPAKTSVGPEPLGPGGTRMR